MRYLLGDFKYDALTQTRPAMTGMFFGTYVALVAIVALNVIIAILQRYFEVVHHELQTTDKWKLSVVGMETHLIQRVQLFKRTHCGCFGRARTYFTACVRARATRCLDSCTRCGCCCQQGRRGRLQSVANTAHSSSSRNLLAGGGGGSAGSSATTRGNSRRSVTTFVANPMQQPAPVAGSSTGGGRSASASGNTAAASALPSPAERLSAVGKGRPRGAAPGRGTVRTSIAKIASMLDMSVDDAVARAAQEARRARAILSDQLQVESWQREARFMAALRAVYHMAKRHKGLDLYDYLGACWSRMQHMCGHVCWTCRS
jgi:hypothetical protein